MLITSLENLALWQRVLCHDSCPASGLMHPLPTYTHLYVFPFPKEISEPAFIINLELFHYSGWDVV